MFIKLSQQLNIILICFLAGIISGFFYLIIRKIKNKCKKNIINMLFDVIFAFFSGFILIFLIHKYYFGYFYLVFILDFVLGIFVCQKTCSGLLDKIGIMLYNAIKRLRGVLCKIRIQKNLPK